MAKQINRGGYDERSTKIMMNKPITELSRFIGSKWFLSTERLAEKSGVPYTTIRKAVEGEKIAPHHEEKLRLFLDKL